MTFTEPIIEALCHIFKYPSSDVCGVFIRSRSESDTICGCVPLFHSACVTVPMLRTCMELLEESEDCVISAIYYASNKDFGAPQYVELLHSQIEKSLGESVPIMRFVPASLLGEEYPFALTGVDTSKGKEGLEFSKTQLDAARDIFQKKLHLTMIVDFEEHLDNPQKDWLRRR